MSLPTSPPAPQRELFNCPCCHDCGWLPSPYDPASGFIPCPVCGLSGARWTTDDCLPVALFDRPEVA